MREQLEAAAASLRAAGLYATPPHVLLTRWLALLASEEPTFVDAMRESGATVPGTRYTFVAVTDTAVCYLSAENDDEFWEHDRAFLSKRPEHVIPRTLVAWRRPLAQVTEVALGGDPWQWLPASDDAESPMGFYVLTLGTDSIDIPLQDGRRRRDSAPDPSSALDQLTATWRHAWP
jgi:hypothetical protein